MIFKTFGEQYKELTPSGKPNYIWALKKYFNQISIDEKFKDSTIEVEYSNYVNNVIKNVNLNIPIDDYDENTLNELLARIEKNSNGAINWNTIIHSYVHLVYRPCKYYNDEFHKDDNKLWGSALSLDDNFIYNTITSQKRSFTKDEEIKITNYLLLNPQTEKGEEVGLSTSFCLGTRDNECTALNFKDIIEFVFYPRIYKVRLFDSTSLHSNELKSGGKSWDMPRYVVAISAYVDYIFKRIDYLNSILTFPITNKDGAFNSVLDLPIACKGKRYTERCRSDDLSRAGRILFRDVLRMREVDVAQIDAERLFTAEIDVEEKSVTTYAFRRNFATHCYNLGFTQTEMQYVMGHVITDIRYRRADFVDEDYLYSMYNKLKSDPINDYYFSKMTIAQ